MVDLADWGNGEMGCWGIGLVPIVQIFNFPTVGKTRNTQKQLMKSFFGGVQMLHGGSFFKKRPPWPPEALFSIF